MNYKQKIENKKQSYKGEVNISEQKIYMKANKHLKSLNLASKALQVGDKIPNIQLPNALGTLIDVNELLKQGPMIITFYRGQWCPFCNLELMTYQEKFEDIQKINGQIVAISPDFPDQSLSLKEKQQLAFPILSDIDNKVAKLFKLVFKVDQDVVDVYQKKGFELNKAQNKDYYELPMPATYVVDQKGIIQLAYVDELYVNRLEPQEAIDKLKSLIGGQYE